MSTVPIFAPDGTLGDIPASRLADAVKAGAKPGVNITAPDGSKGVVPADRYVDAVKAGGKVSPFGEQDVKEPGFWADLKHAASTAIGDVVGGVKHLADNDPMTDPNLSEKDKMALSDQKATEIAARDEWRKKAGYNPAYRALAQPAEMVGMNVPGAEQSAQEGDTAGVIGHVGALPATALAAKGLTEATGAAAPYAGPIAKAALKTADVASFERASKIYNAWKSVPAEIKAKVAQQSPPIPGQPPVYPGAQMPSAPDPAALQAASLQQPGAPPQLPPEAALGHIPNRYQPPAPVAAAAQVPPKYVPPTPAAVESALNGALGGKPLQPNVPLRQQLTSTPKPNAVPSGFTPVDSSVLKAYKYDPATNEFTAITQNGQTYTHGEVTPEQVKAFEDSDSQGKAWTKIIKDNSPLVRKNGAPVKPVVRVTASPDDEAASSLSEAHDDLTDILEKSLAAARDKR